MMCACPVRASRLLANTSQGMHIPCRSLYEFHGPASEAAQWSLRQAERGGLDAGGDLLAPPEPQPRVRCAPCALLKCAGCLVNQDSASARGRCMPPPPQVRCFIRALLQLHSCHVSLAYPANAWAVAFAGAGTAGEAHRPCHHLRLGGCFCEFCGAGAPSCCARLCCARICIPLAGSAQPCAAEPSSNPVLAMSSLSSWSSSLTSRCCRGRACGLHG